MLIVKAIISIAGISWRLLFLFFFSKFIKFNPSFQHYTGEKKLLLQNVLHILIQCISATAEGLLLYVSYLSMLKRVSVCLSTYAMYTTRSLVTSFQYQYHCIHVCRSVSTCIMYKANLQPAHNLPQIQPYLASNRLQIPVTKPTLWDNTHKLFHKGWVSACLADTLCSMFIPARHHLANLNCSKYVLRTCNNKTHLSDTFTWLTCNK